MEEAEATLFKVAVGAMVAATIATMSMEAPTTEARTTAMAPSRLATLAMVAMEAKPLVVRLPTRSNSTVSVSTLCICRHLSSACLLPCVLLSSKHVVNQRRMLAATTMLLSIHVHQMRQLECLALQATIEDEGLSLAVIHTGPSFFLCMHSDDMLLLTPM